MIGIVILVQALPRLLKRDLRAEEKAWLAERQQELPMLLVKQYRVTNSNADGKTLAEINPHRLAQVNITRVRRGRRSFLPPRILLFGWATLCWRSVRSRNWRKSRSSSAKRPRSRWT